MTPGYMSMLHADRDPPNAIASPTMQDIFITIDWK